MLVETTSMKCIACHRALVSRLAGYYCLENMAALKREAED
jgi:hypothetical protein